MRRGRRYLLCGLAAVSVLIVGGLAWRSWVLVERRASIPPPVADPLPVRGPRKDFVGSAACRECHAENHASWHATYHRTMTQVASPATVLPVATGQFDGQVLESRGRRYEFSRDGDRLLVNLVDPDWETSQREEGTAHAKIDAAAGQHRVTRPVVMTTGSHHVQGYWIPGVRGNLLRQIPWYYHIAERRWIPREDSFLEPPRSPRHFMIWNDNCLTCHSTGGSPGMSSRTLEVRTEVAELGIGCEACHGAGRKHVAHHRETAGASEAGGTPPAASDTADPTIVNPARLDHRAASRVCGQCHNTFIPPDLDKFLANGYGYRPGADLATAFMVTKFGTNLHTQMERRGTPVYWQDGACWVGGREYLGLADSGCFQRGKLSCISCHSMHDAPPDDQLAAGMAGDTACLQCHDRYRGSALAKHTHHAADSVGSRCYNCHMPHTSYALLKAIRSHRVDSPRVVSSHFGGRPNACNLCHLDRPQRWTSRYLELWYQHQPAVLEEDEEEVAAGVLLMLQGSPVQRAITAWHAGWAPAREASGNDWLVPYLADLLDDPYSAIRWVAWQALKQQPGHADLPFDFVAPRNQRKPVWMKLRKDWAAGSAGIDADRARRLVLRPGKGLDRVRTEKLLMRRDYREVMVPE